VTGPRALLEIMSRLEGLAIDDTARQVVRNLVVEVGTQYGVRGIGHDDQLAYIQRLLALRVSRSTIRDRLMALYGVSRRHAYRLIDEALQLCRERPNHGTRSKDN
jgi:hypothetical protein